VGSGGARLFRLQGDRVFFDLSGEEYGGWSLAGFAQLATSGLYDVTVVVEARRLHSGGSRLTVRGDRAQSMPEPGAAREPLHKSRDAI